MSGNDNASRSAAMSEDSEARMADEREAVIAAHQPDSPPRERRSRGRPTRLGADPPLTRRLSAPRAEP